MHQIVASVELTSSRENKNVALTPSLIHLFCFSPFCRSFNFLVIVETTGEDGRVHASHVLVSWLDHRTVVSNLVLAIHQETSDKEAKSSGQVFVDCQSMGTLPLANSPKTMKSDQRPIRVVTSRFV